MSERGERSIGAVVRDIGSNVDRIVRAEMGLAVAELRLQVEAVRHVSGILIAGVVAAILAAAFLLLAGMFALARLMPLWLAAMVVAVSSAAIAAALLIQFRAQVDDRLAPKSQQVLPGPRGVT